MGTEFDDDTCLYTLQFADDQVICAIEKGDLEYMTCKLKGEYEKLRLLMNLSLIHI